MKRTLLATAILAAFASIAARARAAQKGDTHEPEFRAFYSEFLKAVRANDKEKLADLIAFPVEDMNW